MQKGIDTGGRARVMQSCDVVEVKEYLEDHYATPRMAPLARTNFCR